MRGFRWITVVVVIALLAVPTMALATDREGVTYAALGDSIAVGTGGTDSSGYVDLLAGHLAREYGDLTLYEVSHDGMTSGMLRTYLTDPASPYFVSVNSAVADADMVTVSIGGNDILQPVVAFVQSNPQYTDPAYIASLTPAEKAALLDYLYAMLSPHVAGFAENWPAIIGYMRTVNPTADIYVNTIYNPFAPGDGLHEIVDPYLAAMNSVIVMGAASPYIDYEVVDAYGRFADYGNPRKALVHGLTSPYALHPTDRGYKFIFNLHKDALAE